MDLRDLVATAEDDTRPAWLDADRLAVDRLGAPLARRIQWDAHHDEDWRVRGTLAGDDRSVLLRFEPAEEPGTERLQVRVPCPEDPQCTGDAWDTITSRLDLLLALDTGVVDDPWCDLHSDS